MTNENTGPTRKELEALSEAFFNNIPRHLRPGGLNATFLNPAFRFITEF